MTPDKILTIQMWAFAAAGVLCLAWYCRLQPEIAIPTVLFLIGLIALGTPVILAIAGVRLGERVRKNPPSLLGVSGLVVLWAGVWFAASLISFLPKAIAVMGAGENALFLAVLSFAMRRRLRRLPSDPTLVPSPR